MGKSNFIVRGGADFSEIEKKMKALTKNLSSTSKSLGKMGSSLTSKLTMPLIKATAAIATGIGALSVAGVTGAAELEAYRNTLNTVMKDTKKAGETMAWAVDFANKTPFETNDIVEATVRLTAYGLKAEKVMPSIGDMASVMNTDIMQAVEAVADAQTGELERLKEFGITKKMIIEHGNKVMKGVQLVNAKGQIVDQEKFNEVLFNLMEERFKGGMEVQANSFNGLMSTMKGTFKNAFTSMVGISETGEVEIGGVFDTLKKKLKLFTDKIETLKKDGTLKKWANDIREAFNKLAKVMEESILPVLKDIIKFVGKIVKWFSELKPETQQLMLKMLLLGAALGPVVTALSAIVGFGSTVAGIITGIGVAAGLAGAAGGMGAFGASLAVLIGPVGWITLTIAALGTLCWWLNKSKKDNAEAAKIQRDGGGGGFSSGGGGGAGGGGGGVSGDEVGRGSRGSIAAFAKGRIVNKPALALIGKAGPEAVIPLDKSMNQTVNHTGTITVRGVNNRDELAAVIEQNITNNITNDNRRIPNRTSLIPIG